MSEARVGIVMGSDSDLEVMRKAADLLDELEVGVEVRVLSAHRTPDKALEWARSAKERGLRVIIAGAGMAAHLPGVLAAVTTLPVIGVPIASGALQGVDALLAIAQMPPGIPVATVAVDGARNAGVLAARILALGDVELARRLEGFVTEMAEKVAEKDERVRAEFGSGRTFGFTS